MKKGKGWEIFENHEKKIIQIIPENDIKKHDRCGCKCNPTIMFENNYTIVSHNAFDKREYVEELCHLAFEHVN